MSKKLIKDSLFTLLVHILVYMKSIVLIPILIKTIGLSMYGTFTLLVSFVGIIFGISSFGVGTKSYRYLPSASIENRAKLVFPQFYFQMFIIFSISLIIFIIYLLDIYKSSFSLWIIPFYLVLYTIFSHVSNYLRYTSRIFYMSLLSFLYAYGHILFILFYIKYIDYISLNVLFASQGVVALGISIPFIVLLYKEIGFRYIVYKIDELKEQIKIGFPIMLNFIVDFIVAASDRFILVFFMGTIAVGIYVPSYTLGAVILLVPKALGTVIPQMMSKNVDNDDFKKAKSIFINSIKFYIIVVIPFVFGIYLISYDTLLLLANEQVAIKGQYITVIVAISSLFYGLNILISQANMVDLKTKVIFKANLIAASLNVVLNIVLLYFIQSIYIPAFTTLVSFMVAFIYFYKSLDKKWLDNSLFIFLIKIIAISLLMFIIVDTVSISYIDFNTIYNILSRIILSIFIYILLIFVFKIYTISQLQSLKRV